MLKLFINFLLLSLIIFLIGCSSSVEPGMKKSNYQIIKEREEFEKKVNADLITTIENNTHTSLSLLMDAHVKILYKIDLPQTYEVSLVKLKEDKNLNINKYLIPIKDYYHDTVTEALYLALEIPYIHILDNELSYSLQITTTNKKKEYKEKKYTLVFRTKPMSDNGEKYLSFEYKNSFYDEDIDPFIKAMIIQEKQNANLNRFSKEYIQKYSKLLRID